MNSIGFIFFNFYFSIFSFVGIQHILYTGWYTATTLFFLFRFDFCSTFLFHFVIVQGIPLCPTHHSLCFSRVLSNNNWSLFLSLSLSVCVFVFLFGRLTDLARVQWHCKQFCSLRFFRCPCGRFRPCMYKIPLNREVYVILDTSLSIGNLWNIGRGIVEL